MVQCKSLPTKQWEGVFLEKSREKGTKVGRWGWNGGQIKPGMGAGKAAEIIAISYSPSQPSEPNVGLGSAPAIAGTDPSRPTWTAGSLHGVREPMCYLKETLHDTETASFGANIAPGQYKIEPLFSSLPSTAIKGCHKYWYSHYE